MSEAIPVSLCLDAVLDQPEELASMSLAVLREEVRVLTALQRTAELMNEIAYAQAHEDNEGLPLAKRQPQGALWRRACVVRMPVLTLLQERIDLARQELARRVPYENLTRH